ncbi:MAG: 30S ribosomal protein S4 [Gemmatimonadaceae bacterium]
MHRAVTSIGRRTIGVFQRLSKETDTSMPVRSPRVRVLRRLGTQLPGLTSKTADRRPLPPGDHGAKTTRRRHSALRIRLDEKQKVRFNYGVTEGQMERYLATARALPGNTGESLLTLLERRLDNVVFRLGFARTIPAARQLISHGHIRVGDQRVDRPSYLLDTGETISLGTRARERESLRAVAEKGPSLRLPSYLLRDPDDVCSGRVIAMPARADVPFPVTEALIIEFYAR